MTYIVIKNGEPIARFPLLEWAYTWARFYKLEDYEVRLIQ